MDSSKRLAAMSRTGRFVAIRQRFGVEIVDALGTSPRVSLNLDDLTDFACIGTALWTVAGGQLRRHSLEGAKPIGTATAFPASEGRLHPALGGHANSALWLGSSNRLINNVDDDLEITNIDGETSTAEFVGLQSGRRALVGANGTLVTRDLGRREVAQVRVPAPGRILAASRLLAGRAVAVLVRSDETDSFLVMNPAGALIHAIKIPRAKRWALADVRGTAMIYTLEDEFLALDLRFGRMLGRTSAPLVVDNLAVDADGKYLLLAGFGDGDTLDVLHLVYTDLFKAAATGSKPKGNGARRGDLVEPIASVGDDAAESTDGAVAAGGEEDAPSRPPKPEVDLDIPLLALANDDAIPAITPVPGAPAYNSPQEHLSEILDLAAARTTRAIADAWDSGKLSLPALDTRPFEREVYALVGNRASSAPNDLALAEERVVELGRRIRDRQRSSLASNQSLPLVDVILQFRLSFMAAQILAVVAAPALRGEIARLYGILANDENRPICDRHLVQTIIGGDDRGVRHAIAAELSDDAALVRYGLIRVLPVEHDQYLFAPLTVDPVLIARLRGDGLVDNGVGAITTIRRASPERLRELAMPQSLKEDIVVALARPPADGVPVRLVIRGRPGAGRRSLLAALAARVNKPLALIDSERLPRGTRQFADRLRVELRRAGLRGAIPCVSGLEAMGSGEFDRSEHVREVFRSHPTPITITTNPEFGLPIDPGHTTFSIPALTEAERLDFWKAAIARRNMTAAGIERVSARFRIGPGTIETVLAAVDTRSATTGASGEDLTNELDATARQHIDVRLGSVASRATRLARWEQVALASDVIDSIREFLSRVAHRRTVYDAWGYDKKMTTSRGLTALFHGPPGTGKSMVASLIARELKLDLYRVDLAQVTSKWIGETEKNLAEVFDAAEDGQAVILFDEADSLFAKRTEVKSSVDRYANLEVNYLLQRFDSFDGIAILTTNKEGSIDTAFKRRLSLRLLFPFPDEEMRARIWLAHMPPEVPTSGDFDFAALAERFPLSGGYIRNSALRAAFLAAQEGVALSQDHIIRAIHLEYREMGKLAAGGKME